jgi:hypothetical protein
MKQRFSHTSTFLYSFMEHAHDHREVGTMARFVGNNFPIVEIHDWRKVQLFPRDAELGHIGNPLLVWSRCGEFAIEQVRSGLANLALVRPEFLPAHPRPDS